MLTQRELHIVSVDSVSALIYLTISLYCFQSVGRQTEFQQQTNIPNVIFVQNHTKREASNFTQQNAGPTGETTATTSTLSITWNRTTIQTSYVKYHHELPYWYGCQNAVNGSQPLPPSMFQPSLFKFFSFLPPHPCVHSSILVARARPSCRHAVDFSVFGQTIWTGTVYTVVVSLSISLSENGPRVWMYFQYV